MNISAIDEDMGEYVMLQDEWTEFRTRALSKVGLEFRDAAMVPLWNSDIGAGKMGKVIVLAESVKYFRRKAMLGIIAHEAGHIYQELHPDSRKTSESSDEAADRLASEWGFHDELMEFFANHREIRKERRWQPLPRKPPTRPSQDAKESWAPQA